MLTYIQLTFVNIEEDDKFDIAGKAKRIGVLETRTYKWGYYFDYLSKDELECTYIEPICSNVCY
jgi:hypothetical protein